ncbi:MAG: respiratory chain complex I subunit 1 family protein [Vicinamibacterales bacterium]
MRPPGGDGGTDVAYVMVAVNLLLFMLLAPFYEGIVRRVTARVQSRQGPPLLQPYFDLLKLLGKERIDAGGTWPFRFAPLVALGAMLVVVAIVPAAGRATALTGRGDLITLVYLLTLSGVAVLMGGFASRNAYAAIGASREMVTMILIEPVLVMMLLTGGIRHGSLDLSTLVGGGAAWAWSTVIMALVSLVALQAFVARQPFDIAEAEIEILDGPCIEYSGPDLALLKYARMLKQMFYAYFLVAVFVPLTGLVMVDLPLQLAAVGVISVAVALVGATNPRFRIDQAVRFYAVLLVISLGAIGLSLGGY